MTEGVNGYFFAWIPGRPERYHGRLDVCTPVTEEIRNRRTGRCFPPCQKQVTSLLSTLPL